MGFWHKKTAKIACFVTGRVKMADKMLRSCWKILKQA